MFNIFSLKAHDDKNLLSETQVGVLGKCHGIDCLVYEMLLIKRVPNSSFNL